MKLLLLEDDITIGEGLRDFLISEGHQVDWVKLIGQAQMRISDDHDAWLLDWNLPDGSGVEWLASLRKQSYTTRNCAHRQGFVGRSHFGLGQWG